MLIDLSDSAFAGPDFRDPTLRLLRLEHVFHFYSHSTEISQICRRRSCVYNIKLSMLL